tara:strand:+ start:430 stop:531 length:102 start_codon:yes stop_codon:yes gene_type:complete
MGDRQSNSGEFNLFLSIICENGDNARDLGGDDD